MFTDTIINTFEMSAKDNQVLGQRKAVGHWLIELFSVGGRKNHFIIVAFSLQSVNAAFDRLYLHDHAGESAKRIIIDTTIFVFGIIAQIVDMYFCKSLILSSFHDGTIEEAFNHLG